MPILFNLSLGEQHKIQNFCQIIGHQFQNQNLLICAITHPSLNNQFARNSKISNKTDFDADYERLEFLGDKVLSVIIAEFLIKKFPNDSEGSLSKRQASLVCGEILAKIALKIELPNVLRLSFGEKKLGGSTNKNNLENAVEALIGAIYLDSGFEAASGFVSRFWADFLQQDILPPQDPISCLQELVQSQTKQLPIYETSFEGGLAHAPIFVSCLKLPAQLIKNASKPSQKQFKAIGNSKKEAQRNVAIIALNHLASQKLLGEN